MTHHVPEFLTYSPYVNETHTASSLNDAAWNLVYYNHSEINLTNTAIQTLNTSSAAYPDLCIQVLSDLNGQVSTFLHSNPAVDIWQYLMLGLFVLIEQ